MKISELLECTIDNRGKTPLVADDGHCLLEINCIAGQGKYPDYSMIKKYVSEEVYNSWFRSGHPRKGDILIPTVGTLDAIGVMDRDDCCIAQNLVAFRANPSTCDGEYLYYLLCSSEIRQRVLNLDIGAVQPSIKVPHLKNLDVEIPLLQSQRKIAGILSRLDEKIALNKEINNNLEQQAQTIYTSIFIDNADPAWQQGHLCDLITVKYGKDHKKLADGSYPVYGSGGIMRYVERPLYDKESVLIPRKGTLNNVMYVSQPFWSVDTMFYSEMRLPNVAKFVFHFVKSKDLASMNAGSAVPSMTADILNALELFIPSEDRLAEFESLVAPMYRKMQNNNQESSKLAALRDTLLPKLMSGEIDVSSICL